MAIDGISSGAASLLAATRQSAAQRTAAAAPAAAQEDRAAVTTTAATMVAEGPPIDQDRVALLRAAIASRSYRPDPQAIAGRMIDGDLGAAL